MRRRPAYASARGEDPPDPVESLFLKIRRNTVVVVILGIEDQALADAAHAEFYSLSAADTLP